MPRIRTFKPEFFTSEDVAILSFRARLTWLGLWTQCDDHGRAKDVPELVKAAVWPLDMSVTLDHVQTDLVDLSTTGRIIRYTVDSRPYLAVVNWHRHQTINRPGPLKFPPPNMQVGAPAPGEIGFCRLCYEADSRNPPGVLTEPSVSPHKVVTDDSHQERKGKEGKGRERNKHSDRALREREHFERFEHFWNFYPRKVQKLRAERAWRAALTRGADPDHLADAAARFATTVADRDPRYVPHPSTWLNSGAYDDEPEPEPQRNHRKPQSGIDRNVQGWLELGNNTDQWNPPQLPKGKNQ